MAFCVLWGHLESWLPGSLEQSSPIKHSGSDPNSSLLHCLTLGKCFNLSESQFLQLPNEEYFKD